MADLRILACAFACCPPGRPGFNGGEDVLGWNLVVQSARFNIVTAITSSRNRPGIEAELKESPIEDLSFSYLALPAWSNWLLRFQGAHQFYYWVWQIRAYFRARQLHKEHNFQLFHHMTYANDWMVSYIGAFLPLPYVRGPGGGAHRTPKGFEKEYQLGGRFWEKIRAFGQWIFRHDPVFRAGQNRASAILICHQESQIVLPKGAADKTQFFPVNGITSADLLMRPSERSGTQMFQVLSAGSLIRVKGFGLAIKAFGKFAEKYSNVEFNIFGRGPEHLRLVKIIRDLGLQSMVHILPPIPREDLLVKMANHAAFLFPSLRDGGGAVVVEAMAMGSPVICLDTGGPGIHVNDDCGVKISPSSPEKAVHELASALERLYLDRDLRQRMGQAGRERAENFYHWDKLGERLMEIYRKALNGQGNSKVK